VCVSFVESYESTIPVNVLSSDGQYTETRHPMDVSGEPGALPFAFGIAEGRGGG
jgi:hypothetical protein